MPLHHLDILIWDFGFLRIPILELDGIFLRSPVELDDGAGVPDAIIKEHPHVGAQGVFLPRLEAVLAAAGRLCRKGGRVLGTGLDLRSLACSLAAAATALALRDELDVIIRDLSLLHFAVVEFYCVLFGSGVELGHCPRVPHAIIKKHAHLRPQGALLPALECPLAGTTRSLLARVLAIRRLDLWPHVLRLIPMLGACCGLQGCWFGCTLGRARA